MKLIYYIILRITIALTLILTVWAVFFYVTMIDEVNDEVDDSLEDYSETIIIRALAGEELPSKNNGSNNQYYLKEITKEYAKSREDIQYKDSMVYIVEKEETEPARILTTIFKDDEDRYYELTVSTPSIEKDDLKSAIQVWIIFLYVALLLCIIIISVWVFYRNMRPLYILLHWLDSYQTGKKNKPLKNDTRITEFRKLNDAATRYVERTEQMFEQIKQNSGTSVCGMEYRMRIMQEMSLMEKLNILSDAAKYDVACTSSGSNRRGDGKGIGNTVNAGICHSFSADGRCISLLKILFTNECIYDCKYCQNRRSNDVPRASFTPDEVCRLTIEFYRRNYIEGLFLSSGIIQNPNVTMRLLYQTIYKLRTQYHFQGYIHVKAIPGADPELIRLTGFLADRMSINLELPTAEGLSRLAPNKHRKTILTPMRQIQNGISVSKQEVALYRHAPEFVPAGQSTQMIIGATPEHDYEILSVAESLYRKFDLKRVFYSAFVKVNEDKDLPALQGGPPLLREHRLYQADWLLRFYGFEAGELLSEKNPDFNLFLDPKADWALRHLEQFPVEVNRASYEELLRVPGIGVKSARRIVQARRSSRLEYQHLKKIGVVLKRAIYFITCNGRQMYPLRIEENFITRQLLGIRENLPFEKDGVTYQQLSLFDDRNFDYDGKQLVQPESAWKGAVG